MIVEELIVALGFDVRGEGELRKFDQHIDRAERRAKTFTATLGRLAIAAGGAIAAFGASRALSGFITDITRTNAQFEQLEVRLKSLEGSAAGAKKAMDFVGEFADRNAADIMEAADAYARLRTFGIDPTTGSLQAVYDAASATGGGLQQLNGITLALGQAWSKQKLQGEEILQLVERGIPVWDLLADATGKNVPALQKLSEAGKLGRREIQLLIDAMGRRFLGQTAEFAKSWDGIITSLISGWKLFQRAIGESGYFDDIKGRVRRLKDTFDRWRRDGTTERLARGISDALQGVLSFGDRAFQSMSRFGHALYFAANGIVALTAKITGLSKEWAAIGLGAAAVGSTAFGRTILLMLARRFPMLAAFLAVDDILAALNGDKSVIGSTPEGEAAIQRLKDRFADFDAALGRLGSTFEGLHERIATAWTDLKARFKEPIKFGGFDLGLLNGAMESVEAWAERTAKRLKLLFTDPIALIMELIRGAIDRVATGLEGLASTVDRISGAIKGIKDFLSREGAGEQAPSDGTTMREKAVPGWMEERFGSGHITVTPEADPISLRTQEETTGEVRKNTESTGSRLDAIKEKLGDLLNFFALTGEAAAAINPGASVYGGGSGGGSGAGRAHRGSPAHGAAGARSMGKDYGGGSYRGDLASGIIAAANELGIDPEDLATAISYETAGTFNPWIKGPTTKWGTHRGLIQWGGPQRKKYGVTKDMSAGEQMQAVARYLRDRGVKPGHGLLEIYSAINAGAVGEQYYGRSDAHAGGAPGTVRDKVNNQMGGHRRKGKALLAAYAAEQAQEAPGPSANDNMAAALKAAGDGVWWLGQNGRTMQGHMDRTSPAGAATRAQNSVTQASQVLNQTINATVNQTVQQAMDAPKAAAQATSDAIAGASRKTPVLARRQVNPGAAP